MTLACDRWLKIVFVAITILSSVDSGWTPWGPYSACSRSCGGGIKYRERLCVLDSSGSECKGKNKVYKVCNTQQCEGPVQDFRAAQCEEFNNQPLDGILYKWKPYLGHGETCELLCFASGFPFYHKLADKVEDGTRCTKDSSSYCVDGKCMSVGCDKKIGSTKVLDVCGVCGGDNNSCSETRLINGIYDTVTLSRGYSTVIDIPLGATNITVRELGENRNPLVFWDSAGNSFAIDAETRKQLPTYDLAGAQFIYSPLDYRNRFGKVKATGPINSRVTIYLVNQGADNPGIEYSFSMLTVPPRTSAEKTDNSVKPILIPPSNMQVSMSNVPSPSRNNAIARTNVRIVDNTRRFGHRKYDTKPKDNSKDSIKEPQYVYENKVQVMGGGSSIRENPYNDIKERNQNKVDVDSSRQIEAYTRTAERHERLESSHHNSEMSDIGRSPERYVWTHGRWTACSNNCGSGFQRRSVSCIDRVERASIDEKYCRREQRPQSVMRCNNGNCSVVSSDFYVRWQVGSWGPCSTSCDLGVQSQEVFCEGVMSDESTKTVEDEMCLKRYATKPQYRRSCNDDRPCRTARRTATWITSAWSECSVTCGSGIRTRKVTCRNKNRRRRLSASSCNDDTRPVDYKRCALSPCRTRIRQPVRPRLRGESCRNSYYGCCPDGVTPARGWNGEGCRRNLRNANTVLAKTGSSKILPCGIKPPEDGEYLVQWRKDGMQFPLLAQYSGYDPRLDDNYKGRVRLVEGTSLQIGYLKESDSGHYQCSFSMVEDYEGTQRKGYRLYLNVRDNIVITEDDAKVKNQDRKSSAASSKCLKLSDRGRLCSKWEAKWFYNSSKSSCERFWYGGCDGNENRFDDEESCMADCKHNEDVCRMSVLMGNCRERLPRWYYDSARRECRYFEYSGCNGNGNRFISRDNCERQCLYGREAFGRQDCNIQRFGCCPDGITAAQGNNNEGCPNACSGTKYGCCDDDMTPAQGPEQEGCEVIEISSGDGVACGDTDYGCCLDGETAATGPNGEGCRGMVTDKPDGDITVDVSAQCKLPSDLGTCRDNMVVMWYYNMSSGRCQMFWYGGCNGNQNRFKSEKECLTICRQVVKEPEKPEVRIPVCDQPKEIGPCRSLIPRWFYNKSTRQCEEFNYGGCLGNQNNFEERETCERYCRRGTPVAKAGECPRMNLDEEGCSSTCYYDGDCPGNEKCCSGSSGCRRCSAPAERDREIELTPEEVCALDKETGPCRGAFTRYYYNSETAKCESFTYGGCRGNRNNFESLDLCRRYCRARREPQPRPSGRQNICEMRPALGPCYRNVTKFFYNINTLSCQTFTYGGCLGNHNNFVTESKCMSYCGLRRRNYEKQDLCKQDSERGSCRGSYTRYYYDARQGRCFEFIYGGCQGNGNNFVSDESCMNTCRGVRIEDRRPVIPRPAPTVQPPTDNRAEGREEDVCSLALITPCTSSQEGPFWYYDRMTGFCREIPNGECNNNRNNFQSRAQCEQYCNRDRACQPLYYTSEIRCLASIPSWTYNRQSGRCEQFNYGGCGGSANNFPNEEACRRKCEDRVVITPVSTAAPVAEDICSLRLQTPCTSSREGPFWYYDRMTGVCKEVPNGECNNNRNNFQSRAQCEQYCNRERVCQPLYYTSNIRCFALIPSWTYDRESGRCEQFDYGGCGGSSNNFASEDACRRKCEDRVVIRPVTTAVPEVASPSEVCAMPADTGNCLAFMMRWRYNAETGKCVQFTWGGCGGNKNNFESQQACEQYCSRSVVCQRYEEPDVECLAYIRRWNYDPQSNQCENFIYGGCGGNSNNFETFEACEEKCKEVKVDNRDREYNNDNRVSTWRDICQMRYDVGPCRQSVTKWFYNSGARKCETFTYGGCLGNHNNFETSEQCMLYCGNVFRNSVPPTDEPEPEIEIEGSGDITAEPIGFDVCHLPSETGVCRASINQWYYNHNMGECMRFIYGGCGGNGNRFSSQEECERQCNDRGICLLKQDTGMGYNFTTRYHFDYSSQSCTAFLFGGEDGNANNFETEAACLRKCDSLIRRAPAPKAGECPARRRNNGLLGACAPQCRDDSQCSGNQKCCYSGCGYKCVDPVSEQSGPKRGYCPAKLDKQGLLGACAPQCQDDRDCSGSQKCCYHGCGLRCVYPVADEPYQMDVPVRIQTSPVSDNSVQVTWSDPSLGGDQRIRDNRYYTIRYFSYDQGQYNYMNVTDLNGKVNGLSSDTEYHFSVRSNNPPYLSEWSTDVMTKTMTTRVVNKPGSCPVLDPNSAGTCVNMCDRDTDCIGAEKCCSNGCGRTCQYPRGYDVCTLPMDRGECSDWEIRWYYKVDETGLGMCERFWFGGCEEQGNGNRFMNQSDCQAACGTPATEPPRTARPYDCRRSMFGCCADRYTPAVDREKSNCPETERREEEIVPVTPGASVTLRCYNSNNGTWYREGKLVESNDRRQVNNDGTLTVYAATIDDDGVYACHVYYGSSRPYIYRYMLQVRNSSDETVVVPIGILDGPDTIIVKPNHMAFLHCEVYGNPKPSVTWMKNGEALRTGVQYETFSNGTLLIRRATEADIDRYTCVADNRVSQSLSRTIKLNLREMIVARIENDNGRVTEGGRITLSCEGRGYPTPTITWEKMGQPIRTGGNVFISSEGRLEIRDATLDDTGSYSCIVANSEEKIETSTSVQVIRRIVPDDDDKCEDRTSLMKCRLIVTARLCGYTMYSKICCNSCKSFFYGRQ